jgi:hypothetical protein
MTSALKSCFLLFLVLASAVLFLHSLFYVQSHDWDIDAFLYLGSRLNDGSLLYLNEFETKLPLVQYVFWLPAQIGGIGAWRMIVFCTALACALIGSYFLVSSQHDQNDSLRRAYPVATLVFLFLFLLYSMPGSSSAHIELFSASLMYCSIALIVDCSNANRKAWVPVVASGALFAMAVFMRPNYVYTLPILCGVFYFPAQSSLKFKSIYAGLLFALGFVAVLTLVFLPYFFYVNGPRSLLEGLRAIANFSQGMTIKSLLMEQFHDENVNGFYIFIYICMVTAPLVALYSKVTNIQFSKRKRLLFFCSLSCMAINFSFLRNHYFPHNSIMFVPYVVLLVEGIYSWWKGAILQHSIKGAKVKKFIFTLILFSLALLLTEKPANKTLYDLQDLIQKPQNINFQINQRGDVDPALLALLLNLKAHSISFLIEGNSIYHRLLHESRIGDGHPAILEYILKRNAVMPVGNIFLLSAQARENPCLVLKNSGKDVVVINIPREGEQNLAFNCLAKRESGYHVLLDGEFNHLLKSHAELRLEEKYLIFIKN